MVPDLHAGPHHDHEGHHAPGESSSDESHHAEQILFVQNSLPQTHNVTNIQSEMNIGESEQNQSLENSPEKQGSEMDGEEMDDDSDENVDDIATP